MFYGADFRATADFQVAATFRAGADTRVPADFRAGADFQAAADIHVPPLFSATGRRNRRDGEFGPAQQAATAAID